MHEYINIKFWVFFVVLLKKNIFKKGCNGSGGKVCGFCHGKRYRVDPQGNRDRCGMCNGSGTERCIRCSGRGSVTCSNCQGSGRLKVYIELEISL